MQIPAYEPDARLPLAHVSVVTGASSGIGASTAELLGRHGSHVVLLGRDAARLRATADAVRAAGARADVVVADLSRPHDVRRAAARIAETVDRVDLLVNNAGILSPQRTETPDGLDAVMAVNHVAPFLLTQELAEQLERRPPSAVVNLSSGAAKAAKLDLDDLQSRIGYGQFQAYARSKAANLIVSSMLAERWRPRRIAVVSYDPGFVRTGMASHTAGMLRLANTLGSPFKTDPAKAAAPILSLALWPGKLSATGLLFNVHGKQVKQPKFVGDSSLTHALWQATEAMAGHDGAGGHPVLDQLE